MVPLKQKVSRASSPEKASGVSPAANRTNEGQPCPPLPTEAYSALAEPIAGPERARVVDGSKWIEDLESQNAKLRARLGDTIQAYSTCHRDD
jgi:hypothetical protein